MELRRATEGAFDIAMAPLARAWSFFDGVRGDVKAAKRVSGMKHVRLEGGTIRFDRGGVAIDLGGIGKGYALDRAAAILRERGVREALLHGGTSTIVALGAWPVGLADPRDPERRLGKVDLCDRAISASSGLGKFFVERGRAYGHILDPRTGSPARGTEAAWVMALSAADADALSTAAYVTGRVPPGVDAVILMSKGKVVATVPVDPAPPRAGFSRREFLKGSAAAAAFGAGLSASAQEGAPAKERTLRVAVVGVGDQGQLLLSQLVRMPNVKVAALCDVYKPHLTKALEISGRNTETYDDVRQLLDEEELDAVVIATPPAAHAGPALAAIKAGLHVFLEAPLAHSADDCRAIAEASAKSKKILMVGHHRRFGKLYPHALKHIKSNAAGNLRLLRAQWHRKVSWRRAGIEKKFDRMLNWRLYRELSCGLLGEAGAHAVDLANWYFESAPKSVVALGTLQEWKDGRDLPDTVTAIFEYPGGQQLQFSASLSSSFQEEFELVMGTNASILLSGQRKGLLFKEPDAVEFGWEHFAKKEMLGPARGILLDAEATKYKTHDEAEEIGPDAGKADFHAELSAFLDGCRRGTAPACGAVEGLKAALPVVAAMESIEKRRVVDLPAESYEVKR
jgi:predicted dehydrogenase